MRGHFSDILKAGNVNPEYEYRKLYDILNARNIQVITDRICGEGKSVSLNDILKDSFMNISFRGTCRSLNEFNRMHNFYFDSEPSKFSIDYLIEISEYIYNLVNCCNNFKCDGYAIIEYNFNEILNHILMVMDNVSYQPIKDGDITNFVEKSPIANAVAESGVLSESESYDILFYNHHSMKGDLKAKKNILLMLTHKLEAVENELTRIDRNFKDDLYFLLNNMDIRHNNYDSSKKSHNKKFLSTMSQDELESYYDDTYQMSLLALLRVENIERQKRIEKLKKMMSN